MDANNDIKKEQIVSSSNYNRNKKTSTTEEQYAFETVSKNINWVFYIPHVYNLGYGYRKNNKGKFNHW